MDTPPPVRLRVLPGQSTEPSPAHHAAGREPSGTAFCARCGRAPQAPGAHARVCGHCGLGLVLTAAGGTVPHASDRFVIVNAQLTVSAVSLTAEGLLGLGQEAALGRPVIELVAPLSAEPLVRNDFLASLRAAARGLGPVRRFDGRAGDERLVLRVAPCGPPPGALLVLGPAQS